MSERLFKMGQTVMTRGVSDEMADDESFAMFVAESLQRHSQGDWGDISPEDEGENERALRKGYRLFSVYEHSIHPTIWIITEADRSVTTILFPHEY